MTESEKMEMLDRCLKFLVASTPECNTCELNHNGICFFASQCLLDEDDELSYYVERRY